MRHDVYHYFQQACRRSIAPVEPLHWVQDDDAKAGFVLQVGPRGDVVAVEYRCTTCMTLVGLCEHLAELLRGGAVKQVCELSAGELLSRHPEIPPARRARANLAVAAARAAIKEIHP